MIFLNAISTFLYMTFLALAPRNESAGKISMINYMQLVFMYFSDLFIFDKKIDFFDVLGLALIFGFNFINGILKADKRIKHLNRMKNSKKENPYKVPEKHKN